ncbi:MAG TPA: hypothetical protein ENJ31_01685 [Anaerolineae bacterium]|nr:hypothetical protein [Anaerolineae bacterium]
MARLYADENFPFPAVRELRRLGHDVLTIQEAGMADQAMPDQDVLGMASKENRVLLTLNRKHFIRLHRQDANHAGIVVCTFDADFVALAHRIHDAIEATPSPTGRLIRVNRPLKGT